MKFNTKKYIITKYDNTYGEFCSDSDIVYEINCKAGYWFGFYESGIMYADSISEVKELLKEITKKEV